MANPAEVQAIQTAYRRRLADFWKIAPGLDLLEVGCGQGDMTAVLAETARSVVALDRAGRDYGAPLTLGQATDLIGRDNVEFWFDFDIIHPPANFGDRHFDVAVMAHSAWYFDSLPSLCDTFRALRSRAKTLCFAEWDMNPAQSDQMAHWLAVNIQEQIENYKDVSEANIRLPMPRTALKGVLAEARWNVEREAVIDTTGMQDADWEIQHCLRVNLAEIETLSMPDRVRETLRQEIGWLETVAKPRANATLPAFALVCRP